MRPLVEHKMMHALRNAWLENRLRRYFFCGWIIEGLMP
jgi:hypothetical protein